MNRTGYLGIDVGSISTNLVVADSSGEVLFSLYLRGGGHPVKSVQQGLGEIRQALSDSFRINGVCTTGSGRHLIGAVVGADMVKNEIMAHARGVLQLHPEVNTIFEIGGQDSKITIVRDGLVVDFAMNLVCAAGTGSFLDSQARRLEISLEAFSDLAVLSRSPTDIAGRCTVFAESDMIHKQQIGHGQSDILMGLCQALVRNYLNNVCRGKEIKPPFVFQGGVSANKGIQRALAEALGEEVLVPRHNMVMGAYGAALLAAGNGIGESRFRGCRISEDKVQTISWQCQDCPNNCEIIEIRDEHEVIGNCGGRCGKWEASGFAGRGAGGDRTGHD